MIAETLENNGAIVYIVSRNLNALEAAACERNVGAPPLANLPPLSFWIADPPSLFPRS